MGNTDGAEGEALPGHIAKPGMKDDPDAVAANACEHTGARPAVLFSHSDKS